jgi:hypothetical protein
LKFAGCRLKTVGPDRPAVRDAGFGMRAYKGYSLREAAQSGMGVVGFLPGVVFREAESNPGLNDANPVGVKWVIG